MFAIARPCPGFTGVRISARAARPARSVLRARIVAASSSGGYSWLEKNPLALIVGFVGWFAPSNIAVSAFDGQSLFGAFTASIGEQLAHFPTGPAVTDKFWLLLVTWHLGLFVTLTLAQIGVQGRKQGYF